MQNNIIIYTDGSALGNPGPGGYGVVMMFNGHRKEFSEGFRKTTNNRMELLAVIIALKNLKSNKYKIIIHSDSSYVVSAIEKGWVFNWQKKGFKKKKNVDLWKKFLELYQDFDVEFKWVKAHIGIPENEKCDWLAKRAAEKPTSIDQVFEEEELSGKTNLFTNN